jgi:hypothetical protein
MRIVLWPAVGEAPPPFAEFRERFSFMGDWENVARFLVRNCADEDTLEWLCECATASEVALPLPWFVERVVAAIRAREVCAAILRLDVGKYAREFAAFIEIAVEGRGEDEFAELLAGKFNPPRPTFNRISSELSVTPVSNASRVSKSS